MAKERIGIMGGTFDPIHEGHLHMARCALDAAHLDRVLMVPTGNPPHKTDIAPAEDRYRMVCAACAMFPQLEPSRIELDRPGKIYTVDTLSLLRQKYPKAELVYLIGSDTLMELRTWREWEKVLKLCSFLVCPRACRYSPHELVEERRLLQERGAQIVMADMDVVEVSSTGLREALRLGEPTPLLPIPVREYASACGLYGMHMLTPQIEAWMARLFAELTVKRFAHTLTVAHTARHLAPANGVDPFKAEVAGLLHDCAKCIPLKDMQTLCVGQPPVEDGILDCGALLHSIAGSYKAQRDYGVTDPEILSAIARHTTGTPGMTKLDMVVYLADKIEPTRPSYPLLDKVRMLSSLSLERAMLTSMEGTTKYVVKKGNTVHPATLRTLAWLRTLPEAQG